MRRGLPLLVVLGLAFALGGAPRPAHASAEGREALLRLRKALRDDDVGERRAAVRHLGLAAGRLDVTERRRATVLLAPVLEEEKDDVVRREAVRSLSRLGGASGWVPVIVASLTAPDETVQQAARQAVLWGGGDYLEVVGRLMKEDEDDAFRARLALLLGDRRRRDAVPLLLDALEDREPRVAAAAAEALEAITKEPLGYAAAAWRAWWEAHGGGATTGPDLEGDGESVTVAEDQVFPEPEPYLARGLVPEFYGLPIHARDVVFVVDVSGSVGAGGVGRAKKELVETVERLASDVHVCALFFDETVHMWRPEMVPATPENKADLTLFLRGIKPGRRTDVMAPLNAGLQIVRRRVEEKEASGEPLREAVALVFVSDGVETSASTPLAVVADKLSRLDPAKTVVHTVVLGGAGSALLAEVARRGGGHYVVVP